MSKNLGAVSAVIGTAVPGLGPVIDAAVLTAACYPAVAPEPHDAKPVHRSHLGVYPVDLGERAGG